MASQMQRVTDALFADRYGLPLTDWLRDKRDAGVPWRRIERELFMLTDGLIDVSHPTLMTWLADSEHDHAA